MRRIEEKLYAREALLPVLAALKNEGKVLGFTNGVFDILHRGHADYLQMARAKADVLIVALNNDESVKRLKGPLRPVNALADRMHVIAALESVDYVTSFSEDTPIETIRLLTPDIHMKAGDYDPSDMPETPIVHAYGGTVTIIPFVNGYSTTRTIEKMKEGD